MTLIETSEVLGNIGEFVGSIAVLVTLIYLAVQVRYSKDLLEENRKIALGQVSQTTTGFRLELQRLREQPNVVELREKVEQGEAVYGELHKKNFDQLSNQEKMLWRSIQAQFAIMIDDGMYQATLGLVDEQDQEILESSARQSMPYWEYFDNYVPSRLKHWYIKQQDI